MIVFWYIGFELFYREVLMRLILIIRYQDINFLNRKKRMAASILSSCHASVIMQFNR
jgi:hypothetical protein